MSAINANYRETPKWQTWPFMHCTITTTVTVIILNPSFYFCFISFLFMPTKRQNVRHWSTFLCSTANKKRKCSFFSIFKYVFNIGFLYHKMHPIYQNLLYWIRYFYILIPGLSIHFSYSNISFKTKYFQLRSNPEFSK